MRRFSPLWGGLVSDETQVQWSGLTDADSGIERCDLEVLRVASPGKVKAGREGVGLGREVNG